LDGIDSASYARRKARRPGLRWLIYPASLAPIVTYNYRWGLGPVIGIALVMVISSSLIVVTGGTPAASPSPAPLATSIDPTQNSTISSGTPGAATTSCGLTPTESAHLSTAGNDPAWASTIQHVKSIAANAVASGLPATALHLPYLGAIPDQEINGVPETGVQIASECPEDSLAGSTPVPSGIAYDGQSERGHQLVNDPTIDSNSLLGILNVKSINNFYPDAEAPTLWGGQLNAVLANVTILGQRGYAFWVQNVVAYDSHNDTISLVDDTWNFTSYTSEMQPSSLVSWSPNGSDYTGVWVAFSPTYYMPPPFTVDVYVNSSVNSAGDQVLWYNYSIVGNGHHYFGSYDNLVFQSQLPGPPEPLAPAPFEASATTYHVVNEGYEFDAFIGSDDGSNQLVLAARATEQLKYCSLTDCTPGDFAYANVPAAVNFGSQTGEETVGVAVNYFGTTAYLSAGPLILHGLWNFTGQPGVAPGNTKVENNISVTGSPVPITEQPYVFVFFKNIAFGSEGFQWAADQPAWYLMPGTYRYLIMLSDYKEQTGLITVGSSPVTLTASLPYSPASGVYTPLWAFDNGQVAGISSKGSGAIADQYVLFNNPTSGCSRCGSAPDGSLSPVFYSQDDYTYKTFPGVFLSGTSRYIDVNAPPSFRVFATGGPATSYYLNFQFYQTSHVTLSHAAAIRGWPAQGEFSFYISVPASQNPAPEGDVYVWNSTHDLIMSNNFVAEIAQPGDVSPDQLVLYGGTDNVVWGNTFRDPPGAALGDTYAGIGIAESGDLIYNNNFEIDNPVVYLPFNFPNVADCLPQCEQSNFSNTWFYNLAHDTWNIAPQPASNVARTVNGFPLSGNVMGPGYTVVGRPHAPSQGGNFFWNFGRSPNNRTTIPYVSRFLYTDWSNIFPLGCGTIQAPGAPCGTAPPIVGAYENGIQFGGDYAPIIPIPHTAAISTSGVAHPRGAALTTPSPSIGVSGLMMATNDRTAAALRMAGSRAL
jgi:thermopsin